MMSFIQPRRPNPIHILIPYSYAYDTPSLREATARIGFLGRVLATFRVERLVLYRDREGEEYRRHAHLVKEILDYLCTAPYLRKRLYRLKPSLRYAGLLPPLNIPTHPEVDDIKRVGTHYRQALVIAAGHTSVVDAGLRRDIRIPRRLAAGSRIIIKAEVGEARHRFQHIAGDSGEVYDGFTTAIMGSLQDILRDYQLRIATSRKGENIAKIIPELVKDIGNAQKTCIAFGAADRGLYEIVEETGGSMEKLFHKIVNTVPGQGVRTVRTEEALAYTLAIINIHLT
jgi:predicted SPOUT superfamily RNA methylase MTH1